MQVCSNCGEENPARFRLCGFCGTPLAQLLPRQEVRKTVTIVFSDLQGSTSLGEKLDAESLREVLSRYFEVMRLVLEEHGGIIEKYIGDAIMAVFGLPRVHEDDALRAVSATARMRQSLETLNDELSRRWGVRLVNRTGVNTGEVVAGDPASGQRLVSGDTVNVAARLEQAAPPLDTLISESTYRLVRHAVDVQAVEPLQLKGKTELVPAFRLLGVRQRHTPLPRSDVPLVGRQAELDLLLGVFEEAKDRHLPRVITLRGDPGVGKTRLIEEFTNRTSTEALVLEGRCLSYGRGITFWPLVEIVRAATGVHESDPPEVARDRLQLLLPEAADVAARLASVIGMTDTAFPVDEIAWATRRFFEVLAAERPVVVIVEDVHWAEAAFLDLLEYVADHVTGSLVLACSGRPELLESRPSWRDRPNWLAIDLEPLAPSAGARLVESLFGAASVPALVRDRVSRAAQGNPLFAQQLVAMLIDEGFMSRDGDTWRLTRDLSGLTIPGSIQGLLAARLDLLGAEERAIVEPASVIGHMFSENALVELVPASIRSSLGEHLELLIRKRLVQPEPDQAGERWYRFQHILIRDTAYAGLLKRTRAQLHERFADWSERVNAKREGAVEYEEIHGYHFEQAYQYLSELGPLDEHGRQIGARGANHLGRAGTRAFERGDMAAASNLLHRAVSLFPERAPERVALAPSLSEALMESGEFALAQEFLQDAIQTATERGDERLLADATLSQLLVRRPAAEDLAAWCAEVKLVTSRLIPVLESGEAHAELAKAWRLAAFVDGSMCRWQDVVVAEERGIEHARLAGRHRLAARMSAALAQAVRDGPTPVPEAIRRCEAILADGLVDQQAEVIATLHLAYLYALAGDLVAAQEFYRTAQQRLADLAGGGLTARAFASLTIGRIELLAGDLTLALQELGREFETLGNVGEWYFRPLIGALLAEALSTQGAWNDSLAMTSVVEAIAAPDDVEAQALWRAVRAKFFGHAGEHDRARELSAEAVAIVSRVDAPILQADVLMDQASVLMLAGDVPTAIDTLSRARAFYAAKGAALPLRRADAMLAGLELLPASVANRPVRRAEVRVDGARASGAVD